MGENQFAELYDAVVAEKAKRKAAKKEGKPKRVPPTPKKKADATPAPQGEKKSALKKVPGLAKAGKKEPEAT